MRIPEEFHKCIRKVAFVASIPLSIIFIFLTVSYFKDNLMAASFFSASIVLELWCIAWITSAKEQKRILFLPLVSAFVTLVSSFINLNGATQWLDLYDCIENIPNHGVTIALLLYMGSIYVLVSTLIKNKECKARVIDYLIIVAPFALATLGASYSLQ
ncbi:hypothetical protein OPW19_13485 [Vibrio europaeus]|uniref:hypothetical protein n=1 Tax=Vibrio europaeus TaxID=300876 RepID=UPI00233ECF94|nr:hypothetical protein [Vibrio europaeus]MDC5820830.1 hypothetical protein [Vibrio europaeus]